MIQFLLITPGVETTDFSTLRAIVYGASPITDDGADRRRWRRFGCEFIQVYGLTETTGAITQLDGDDHDPVNRPELLRSCGKPYPWVEIRVVDPETGDDVADRRRSASCGPARRQNMKGYWNNPEATAAADRPTTAGSRPATPATSTTTASCSCTTG